MAVRLLGGQIPGVYQLAVLGEHVWVRIRITW